ncbi:protein of unknown function [Methylocella tundrae]|uniref:Uncharacterized protein n=1 Tax=Methylocella tundrae TaxID=227605 RepID=A0A4U8Z4K1_METTU|nr:protein of unknown function [Methylocella tundrae]
MPLGPRNAGRSLSPPPCADLTGACFRRSSWQAAVYEAHPVCSVFYRMGRRLRLYGGKRGDYVSGAQPTGSAS